MILNSRSTKASARTIIPLQTATAPARIKVLPKLNSLTGIPSTIASRPDSTAQIPAISKAIIIKPPQIAAVKKKDHQRVIHIAFSVALLVQSKHIMGLALQHRARKLATMANYLARELRYIGAGHRSPEAPNGAKGTPLGYY
ncbi:MAG: hypothetical protein JO283_01405 [Bradyrhizobium sp.]|nr:hypothetical protein [Bradyrhizobium sp.]